MKSLPDRVRDSVRRHDLIPPGSRVLVALSGGADSVALVHLLREIAAGGRPPFTLAGVAHFNHRLRGAADADEAFCRALAFDLSLPIDVEAADVAAAARARKTSIEDAARQARYAFLERAAIRLGAGPIAVGHTCDDQAETFLLRLLRGAGPRGLAAIHPRAGRVIRPLLEIRRQELRTYLAETGTTFVEDETNRDLRIPRNRVRHEVLPYVRRHLSPGVVRVLARAAAVAREDADYLEGVAHDAARSIVLPDGAQISLDLPALRTLPPALARRVVRAALADTGAGAFVGFDHVEMVLRMAWAEPGAAARADLPGQRAIRSGDRVVLTRAGPRRSPAAAVAVRRVLPVPGEILVAELGIVLSAEGPEPVEPARLEGLAARGDWAAVEASAISGPLAVRTRQPGDAFRPLGLRGRKKLQDFFVDRKIARSERDAVPLVVDAQDRIVWVVGQSVADDFRVTSRSEAVILLKARRLGGAG